MLVQDNSTSFALLECEEHVRLSSLHLDPKPILHVFPIETSSMIFHNLSPRLSPLALHKRLSDHNWLHSLHAFIKPISDHGLIKIFLFIICLNGGSFGIARL